MSTDVETDGPVPGLYSMLSLGSAAYLADKTLLSTFSATLRTLQGATAHPQAMQWWDKRPDAWRKARQGAEDPQTVMQRYLSWVQGLSGKPVFVAYPAGFDFMFVSWYLIRFTGQSPFSHSALDIKTYAMAMMKTPFFESTKRTMPRHWFEESPHTHQALDDAIEQGLLFCNMLAENCRHGQDGGGDEES